jgi:MSHA biogenesis protein MshP
MTIISAKRRVMSRSGVLRRHDRGFSLVTAIFLLVVLSALGAFMVVFTGQQQTALQVDVLGVRAYYAARAGSEWALYRAIDPDNTIAPGAAAFVPCPEGTINTMGGSLAAFTVVVSCTATVPDPTEAGRTIRVYQITATACNQASCPAPSSPAPAAGYVERSVVVTVAKCKDQDPAAVAPFRCGI